MSEALSLDEFSNWLRACGVRRAVLAPIMGGYQFEAPGGRFVAFQELELSDTIPAPPSFETMPNDFPPAESKDPSLCQGVGCALPGGWQGTAYCRAHGLSAAGVRT